MGLINEISNKFAFATIKDYSEWEIIRFYITNEIKALIYELEEIAKGIMDSQVY